MKDENTRTGAVLVTGAAQRLGREIALGLARAGHDVVVHFHRSAEAAATTVADIESLGRRAVAVGGDLADAGERARVFDEAVRALPVEGLVNNASLFEFDSPGQFEAATLERHLAPNLVAPVDLAARLHDHLGEGGHGFVVNLLDQKLENLNPDYFSYTVSKFGLLGATRMMAIGCAPRLRVAAVSPGITLASGEQTEEEFQAAHRLTPLGRSSSTADIVDAVVFLAGSPAITGINLIVDGGQHLVPLARDVMFVAPHLPTHGPSS
ncbi:MAG: SDR family oxidoreductase [Burkholderiaceae bacterium]|nr:SDR family oxidoreductase [Burkholderiaceae bacterium]